MTNYGISIYFYVEIHYVKIQQNTSYTSMPTSMDIIGYLWCFFLDKLQDFWHFKDHLHSRAQWSTRGSQDRLRRHPLQRWRRCVVTRSQFFSEAKWKCSWNSRLSPFFSEFPLYSLEVFSMPETSSFPWVNHEISGVDNFSLNFTLSNIVWLVEPTPLKNDGVSWDYYFQYMEKKSKPPTSCPFLGDTWW